MECKQANIFGGCISIVIKDNKDVKPKELSDKGKELRYKLSVLYEMYEQLYKKQNIPLLEQKDIIIKNNILVYPDERQAEPIELINTTLEDIDQRIEVMRKILCK